MSDTSWRWLDVWKLSWRGSRLNHPAVLVSNRKMVIYRKMLQFSFHFFNEINMLSPQILPTVRRSVFFCSVVEAGCPLGWWSGWGECRIIGAMLYLVSVALQCWGSGTWKHWLNSYQSFQTPGRRKASWASFLSGPRPVEVQRDSEAHRPVCVRVCVCVCVHSFEGKEELRG